MISFEELMFIHNKIIEETGGSYGVRDENLARSAIERPFMTFGGKDLYPTIFLKAAACFQSVSMNHAFIDANKRTAITISARLLEIGGYSLHSTNEELESFVIHSVENKSSIEDIALWFETNSTKS